ncbi:MAG: hypothetical protein DWQ04_28845 [Chloroflexi bacterium]|nr:MAG: hypothetical protein DWQ04_28845 [Chloroflexota bacterium]
MAQTPNVYTSDPDCRAKNTTTSNSARLHSSLYTPLTHTLNDKWLTIYRNEGSNEFYFIQPTNDGGYILAGEISHPITGADAGWLLKLNQNGSTMWQKAYGDINRSNFRVVQETSDHGYIIVGQKANTPLGAYSDFWVVKVDQDGGVSWQKTYDMGSTVEVAVNVRETADGGFVVIGHESVISAGDYDAWVFKVNSNGSMIWQKIINGVGITRIYDLHETSDGGFVIVGRIPLINIDDSWLLKLDSKGDVIWQKVYTSAGVDIAYAIQETSDGGFIIAGQGAFKPWVAKLNTNGSSVWQKQFSNTDNGFISAVQETENGDYVMTTAGSIVRLSSNGDLVWQKSYAGYPILRDITVASDGGLIVTGSALPFVDDNGGLGGLVMKITEAGISDCQISQNIDFGLMNVAITIENSAIVVEDTTSTIVDTTIQSQPTFATTFHCPYMLFLPVIMD